MTTPYVRPNLSSTLITFRACDSAVDWSLPFGDDWERALDACPRLAWLFWLACSLVDNGYLTQQPFVAVACSCVRLTLRFIPTGEERPRIAIEVAECWMRGETTDEEVRLAQEGAWAAWNTLRDDSSHTPARVAAILAAHAAARAVTAVTAVTAVAAAARAVTAAVAADVAAAREGVDVEDYDAARHAALESYAACMIAARAAAAATADDAHAAYAAVIDDAADLFALVKRELGPLLLTGLDAYARTLLNPAEPDGLA